MKVFKAHHVYVMKWPTGSLHLTGCMLHLMASIFENVKKKKKKKVKQNEMHFTSSCSSVCTKPNSGEFKQNAEERFCFPSKKYKNSLTLKTNTSIKIKRLQKKTNTFDSQRRNLLPRLIKVDWKHRLDGKEWLGTPLVCESHWRHWTSGEKVDIWC